MLGSMCEVDKNDFYANALDKRVVKLGTRTLSEPSICVRRNRDKRSREKMVTSLVIWLYVLPKSKLGIFEW